MHPGLVSQSVLVVFVFALFTAAGVSVRNLGQTVSLGDFAYYIPGQPELSVDTEKPLWQDVGDAIRDASFLPVTHVRPENDKTLASVLGDYARADDVWNEDFSHHIILTGDLPSDVASRVTYDNVSEVYVVHQKLDAELSQLPPGPYFAQVTPSRVTLFKALRIYHDPAGAFYYGTVQDGDGSFRVVPSASSLTHGAGATIAVPSRLYYPAPTPEQPLSGVRVGIKDLYDLQGLRTSAGSRAWHATYPPAGETAPSVQLLLDLGAVVIGKTRTSQFGNGQGPAADWVDFQGPFGARGDGYQDPSASSAGMGAAQSAYEWVDMNVGSDTGGSVRAPAAVGGVFGNRPTQHAMSLEGVVPMSAHMDTPAFVARSASEFASWGRAWYGAGNASLGRHSDVDSSRQGLFPRRLVYPIETPGLDPRAYPSPGFFPVADGLARDMFERFTLGLERVLGVERTETDFYTAYKQTSGTGVYPPDHLASVWSVMTTYEQSNGVFSQLSRDWGASHGGDQPYLDPPVAANRDYGRSITEDDFGAALLNKTVFAEWLAREMLTPLGSTKSKNNRRTDGDDEDDDDDDARCSSALLIHPIWTGQPRYRDEYRPSKPGPPKPVWNQYGISQLGGVPEVVIPLGDVEYESRVTGTRKKLPVAVSVNAAAGCDMMLFRLVERLADEGVIPSKVGVGEELAAVYA